MTPSTILQFCTEHLHHLEDKGSQIYADCPYCGKSSHWNISKMTGKHHCYRCNKGGSFNSLIKKVLGYRINVSEVLEEYSEGLTMATMLDLFNKEITEADMFFNWKENTIELTGKSLACKRAVEYLATRNISLNEAIELGMLFGTEGKYAGMIIIPIYFQEEVVNFIARKVPPATGKRYNGPHKGEAIMDKSELLGGFDGAKNSNSVVIVEGYFDRIALVQKGVNAVDLMGKAISTDQILLVSDNWDEVIILLDGGFLEAAIEIGTQLTGLTTVVKIGILHGEEDPSENVEAAIKALGNAKSIECFL